MKIKVDLTGKKFGRLTAIVPLQNKKWRCKCSCGNQEYVDVFTSNLVRGHTLSCGCLQSERAAESNRRRTGWRKENANKRSAIYTIWKGMNARCTSKRSKSYKNYGGRGIVICSDWKDFSKFRRDMEPLYSKGLTIERINNNGNYEPSNCKWVEKSEQGKNTRKVKNITVNGVSKSQRSWSIYLGGCSSLVYSRIKYGWSKRSAATTPL